MAWNRKTTWFKKIKWNKKTVGIVISFVVIALMIIVYAIKSSGVKPKQVTIEKVEKLIITESSTATGNIEAKYRNNIALDPSQKVIKIEVKEGQLVKKGDLLLKLDSSDYQTKLEKQLINIENAKLTSNQMTETGVQAEKSVSENSFSQAKYTLENAQRKYDDYKKKYEQNEALFTSGAIAQSELDEVKKNLDDASTGVKSAEDSLKNAENALRDTNNSSENKIINQKNQIALIQKDIDDYKKK